MHTRGTGDAQYPPAMLLGLLVYSYATGTFGSRRIEPSTHDNVAVRLLTADTHPAHDTICTFRRENQALVRESFVKVLQLAQELKLAQFGPITVSIDGTRIAAHASKHPAVSYERAGQMLEQLAGEVQPLLAKAEQADSTPRQDGLTSPAAIAPAAGPVASVLVDSGFFREAAVRQVEQTAAGTPTGTVVYAPLDKTSHHRSVAELEKRPEPAALAADASVSDLLRYRLKTSAGKALYKLRQQTVGPVFGIIKAAMGFRQFLLRGAAKAATEWTLVCLADNRRRLHTLGAGAKLATAR